jgi:hypothetical protein
MFYTHIDQAVHFSDSGLLGDAISKLMTRYVLLLSHRELANN